MLRLSHFFIMIDYVIGAVFSALVLLFVSQAYALGGPPKEYERRLVADAFADVLRRVEASAYDLRAAYCNEEAAEAAQRGSHCEPVERNAAEHA